MADPPELLLELTTRGYVVVDLAAESASCMLASVASADRFFSQEACYKRRFEQGGAVGDGFSEGSTESYHLTAGAPVGNNRLPIEFQSVADLVCPILDSTAQRFLRCLCSMEELGMASPYALFPMLDCHPWAPKRSAASSLDAVWAAGDGQHPGPQAAAAAAFPELGFVTVLYSTSNSVQVQAPASGEWQEVTLHPSQVVVIPGRCLWHCTAGHVPAPYFRQGSLAGTSLVYHLRGRPAARVDCSSILGPEASKAAPARFCGRRSLQELEAELQLPSSPQGPLELPLNSTAVSSSTSSSPMPSPGLPPATTMSAIPTTALPSSPLPNPPQHTPQPRGSGSPQQLQSHVIAFDLSSPAPAQRPATCSVASSGWLAAPDRGAAATAPAHAAVALPSVAVDMAPGGPEATDVAPSELDATGAAASSKNGRSTVQQDAAPSTPRSPDAMASVPVASPDTEPAARSAQGAAVAAAAVLSASPPTNSSGGHLPAACTRPLPSPSVSPSSRGSLAASPRIIASGTQQLQPLQPPDSSSAAAAALMMEELQQRRFRNGRSSFLDSCGLLQPPSAIAPHSPLGVPPQLSQAPDAHSLPLPHAGKPLPSTSQFLPLLTLPPEPAPSAQQRPAPSSLLPPSAAVSRVHPPPELQPTADPPLPSAPPPYGTPTPPPQVTPAHPSATPPTQHPALFPAASQFSSSSGGLRSAPSDSPRICVPAAGHTSRSDANNSAALQARGSIQQQQEQVQVEMGMEAHISALTAKLDATTRELTSLLESRPSPAAPAASPAAPARPAPSPGSAGSPGSSATSAGPNPLFSTSSAAAAFLLPEPSPPAPPPAPAAQAPPSTPSMAARMRAARLAAQQAPRPGRTPRLAAAALLNLHPDDLDSLLSSHPPTQPQPPAAQMYSLYPSPPLQAPQYPPPQFATPFQPGAYCRQPPYDYSAQLSSWPAYPHPGNASAELVNPMMVTLPMPRVHPTANATVIQQQQQQAVAAAAMYGAMYAPSPHNPFFGGACIAQQQQQQMQQTQQMPQQYMQQAPQQYMQQAPQQYMQQMSQQYMQQAPQQYMQQASQQYMQQASQQYMQQAPQQLPMSYGQEATQQPAAQASQQYMQPPQQQQQHVAHAHTQPPPSSQWLPTQLSAPDSRPPFPSLPSAQLHPAPKQPSLQQLASPSHRRTQHHQPQPQPPATAPAKQRHTRYRPLGTTSLPRSTQSPPPAQSAAHHGREPLRAALLRPRDDDDSSPSTPASEGLADLSALFPRSTSDLHVKRDAPERDSITRSSSSKTSRWSLRLFKTPPATATHPPPATAAAAAPTEQFQVYTNAAARVLPSDIPLHLPQAAPVSLSHPTTSRLQPPPARHLSSYGVVAKPHRRSSTRPRRSSVSVTAAAPPGRRTSAVFPDTPASSAASGSSTLLDGLRHMGRKMQLGTYHSFRSARTTATTDTLPAAGDMAGGAGAGHCCLRTHSMSSAIQGLPHESSQGGRAMKRELLLPLVARTGSATSAASGQSTASKASTFMARRSVTSILLAGAAPKPAAGGRAPAGAAAAKAAMGARARADQRKGRAGGGGRVVQQQQQQLGVGSPAMMERWLEDTQQQGDSGHRSAASLLQDYPMQPARMAAAPHMRVY